MSVSALSIESVVSIKFPSVFHISNKPPTSSPIDRAGGPSIVTIDLPSLSWPVIILLIMFSLFL